MRASFSVCVTVAEMDLFKHSKGYELCLPKGCETQKLWNEVAAQPFIDGRSSAVVWGILISNFNKCFENFTYI